MLITVPIERIERNRGGEGERKSFLDRRYARRNMLEEERTRLRRDSFNRLNSSRIVNPGNEYTVVVVFV